MPSPASGKIRPEFLRQRQPCFFADQMPTVDDFTHGCVQIATGSFRHGERPTSARLLDEGGEVSWLSPGDEPTTAPSQPGHWRIGRVSIDIRGT